MKGPVGIALDDDVIYAADIGNKRILSFNAVSGEFIRVLVKNEGAVKGWYPYYLSISKAADGASCLCVLDNAKHVVHVFDAKTGRHIRAIGDGQLEGPEGVAVYHPAAGGNPQLFVADFVICQVLVFDQTTGALLRTIGRGKGQGPGHLDWPRGINLQILPVGASPEVLLYVCDMGNHRLQVFDALTGQHLPREVRGLEEGGGFKPFSIAVQTREDGITIAYVGEESRAGVRVLEVR